MHLHLHMYFGFFFNLTYVVHWISWHVRMVAPNTKNSKTVRKKNGQLLLVTCHMSYVINTNSHNHIPSPTVHSKLVRQDRRSLFCNTIHSLTRSGQSARFRFHSKGTTNRQRLLGADILKLYTTYTQIIGLALSHLCGSCFHNCIQNI